MLCWYGCVSTDEEGWAGLAAVRVEGMVVEGVGGAERENGR